MKKRQPKKKRKTLGIKRKTNEFKGKVKTFRRARFSLNLDAAFFDGYLAEQTLPNGEQWGGNIETGQDMETGTDLSMDGKCLS